MYLLLSSQCKGNSNKVLIQGYKVWIDLQDHHRHRHIYIYIYRERERERAGREGLELNDW